MFKQKTLTILVLIALLLAAVPTVLAQTDEEEPFDVVLSITGVVEAVDELGVTVDGAYYYFGEGVTADLFVLDETVSVDVIINEDGETMTIIGFTEEDEDGDDGVDDTVFIRENHPVASTIAEGLDVDYDAVIALYAEEIGFGEIARAYLVAAETGADVTAVLEAYLAVGCWDDVLAAYDITPNDFTPGSVISGNKSDYAPQDSLGSPVEDPIQDRLQDGSCQDCTGGGNMGASGNGQGGRS